MRIVVVAALTFVLLGCGPHPPEVGVVSQRFANRRREVDELTHMIESDARSQVGFGKSKYFAVGQDQIGTFWNSWGSWTRYGVGSAVPLSSVLVENGLTQERYAAYVKALRGLAAKRVAFRLDDSGTPTTALLLYTWGIVPAGCWMEITNEHLTPGITANRDGRTEVTALADGWSIAYRCD